MQRLDFNTGWHFSCPDGHDFDVTLPHDAMLNTPRNTEPGFTWFLLAGWRGNDYTYTKNLHITSELINKHLVLEFEGVYCMTTVTVNDRPAAEKAYGYTPFTVELDGLLREGDNTIEVTAHVPQDGHNRWYTGGGIYRPVHLLVGEDAYMQRYGVRVTTLSVAPACVRVEVMTHGGDCAEVRIAEKNGKEVVCAKAAVADGRAVVELEIPDAKPIEAVPQDIPLEIVYEDEHLLVVNKPKGMVVHPAPGNPDGTLVNALLWHCKGSLSGIGGEIRPGIVHRIDKDTSGLLVVAKDDATHIGLSQQMAVHSVERAYRTIVYGGFAQDEGFVESNLGRSKTDRKKMAVYPASEPHTKYAYTGYQVLERLNNFTMLECRLKTGRTHQIRVHMASIQHPVAGDPVYGPHNCITSLHGQCLHAKTLGFVHPITGEHLRFDSELPEYFTRFLATLRRGTV